jgi:hypothetical protein
MALISTSLHSLKTISLSLGETQLLDPDTVSHTTHPAPMSAAKIAEHAASAGEKIIITGATGNGVSHFPCVPWVLAHMPQLALASSPPRWPPHSSLV